MKKIVVNRDDIINTNLNGNSITIELKEHSYTTCRLLRDVPVGETFKIGGEEWIVLEQRDNTTAILKKDLLRDTIKFDDTSNNFVNSAIYKFLNVNYYSALCEDVHKSNICEHTVDLTSDDGLNDYGKRKAYVSLLTCEQYRKYTNILLRYNPGQWWWLATALSTPIRAYSNIVRCVYKYGTLNHNFCNCSCGVRPFVVLNNSLNVDEV